MRTARERNGTARRKAQVQPGSRPASRAAKQPRSHSQAAWRREEWEWRVVGGCGCCSCDSHSPALRHGCATEKHGSIIEDGRSGLGEGRPGARPLTSSSWCNMRCSSTSRTENTPYQRCCKPVELALCPRTSVCRIVVCPHLARRGSSKFHMCCAMMLPLTIPADTLHCALARFWSGFNRTRSVLASPPRHESDT